MQIDSQRVVMMHYTLTNDAGEVLDTSRERGEPLTYLHGTGNIIPGLEQALEGKTAGEKLQVTVAPAQGYGEHDAKLIQKVPRRAFKGISDLRVGMQLQAQGRPITVTQIAGDMVTIDGNHALAGQTLHFDVEIVEVRAASAEEMSHGHVHGPGGHHH